MTGWARRPRAWVAVAGCLAVCAASVTVSTAAAPLRDAPAVVGAEQDSVGPASSMRVLQMNLCGSGAARCYTGRSVPEASEMIRAQAPDAVTLNEVCRDDVTTLERTMAGTGSGGVVVSAFQAAWDRRTGAALQCRTGRPYGIGLVARLTPVAGGYAPVGGIYPVQDPRSAEERAWLCLSPAVESPAAEGPVAPGPAVAVCTTHLASSSPTVARAQCGYLLGTAIPAVRARAGSVPVVLGGDLNLRSGPDVRSCVPAGDRRADDGLVQHVVASSELMIGSLRTIAMLATDHPGLLVTLTRAPAAAPVVLAGNRQ
jgi:endonuclease/exonuclease/phosphatase (EEP) superfamily protein YafD